MVNLGGMAGLWAGCVDTYVGLPSLRRQTGGTSLLFALGGHERGPRLVPLLRLRLLISWAEAAGLGVRRFLGGGEEGGNFFTTAKCFLWPESWPQPRDTGGQANLLAVPQANQSSAVLAAAVRYEYGVLVGTNKSYAEWRSVEDVGSTRRTGMEKWSMYGVQ